MIITRSPLRITLGGGGTDLPSYYKYYNGFLIAGAINRYIYITLHETFVKDLIIKYSKYERVPCVDDIQHPIIREAFKLISINNTNLEVVSIADIPEGTGLGSSGAFTCALLQALNTYKKNIIHPNELAEQACHIEIDLLKEPIGKQDQYISAYGGITCFEFNKDDTVKAYPLNISDETLHNLEDNLLLFFTGYSRSASSILKEQDNKTKIHDTSMIENLHYIKHLGYKSKTALESGDINEFAELMHEHWQYKKERSPVMSNPKINDWYDIALKNGAIGGKLIGAGGGGFLLFYTNQNTKLRKAMAKEGLKEVHFSFDFSGTKNIL